MNQPKWQKTFFSHKIATVCINRYLNLNSAFLSFTCMSAPCFNTIRIVYMLSQKAHWNIGFVLYKPIWMHLDVSSLQKFKLYTAYTFVCSFFHVFPDKKINGKSEPRFTNYPFAKMHVYFCCLSHFNVRKWLVTNKTLNWIQSNTQY